jgi:tape measure domain-containing protein
MANTLAAELILDISKFRRGIRDAQNAVNKSFRRVDVGGGIVSGIAKSGAMIAAALAAVIIGGVFGAAAVAGRIVMQGIKTAAENEKVQMRFEILTGNRGVGNQMLNKLREDAIRTGVELESMAGTVGKFMAFGFDPDKALALNAGILDMAGAVGMSAQDTKLLGVALSQVAAKGVASMEELRQQIAEKGIPIFKALEEQLGVTGAELSDMIQEGKVGSDVVIDMFTKIPAGEGPFAKFAGGAEKMGRTLPGIVARMKTTWKEFLRLLGDPIIDSLKPMMEAALSTMQGLIPKAKEWGQSIADAVSFISAIGPILASIPWIVIADIFQFAFMIAVKEWVNFMWAALQGVSNAFVAYMVTGWTAIIQIVKILMQPNFWAGLTIILIAAAVEFIAKLYDGVVKVGKYLGDAVHAAFTGGSLEVPDFLDGDQTPANIDTLIQTAMDGVAATITDAGRAFEESFRDSKDPFDSTDEKESLKGIMSGISDAVTSQFERLKSEQRARTAERNRTDGTFEGTGSGSGQGGMGAGGFGLNGIMSQAINVISGRSAFAVIADSAARSEQTQQQMKEQQQKANRTLEIIEKNTRGTNIGPTIPSADMVRFR